MSVGLLECAAGSFLPKKLCSRLHSIEVDFCSKKGKIRFLKSAPRGNIRTSSIARWKAHVRLPIRHNCTLFASLAVTAETLQAETCRRERFLKGVGHTDRPLKVEVDVAHQPLLGGRKLE